MNQPLPGLRRRALLTAAAAAGLSNFDLSLRDGLLNKCLGGVPPSLRDDPRLRGVWQGLDATKVWDVHVHVLGDGASGSGLWFNPRMSELTHLQEYVRRKIYINASCIDDRPGRIDLSFMEHLLAQCQAMPPGFKTMLFAFDWARDEAGAPMKDVSTYYASDEHMAAMVAKHPARFEWVASVHPNDPRAGPARRSRRWWRARDQVAANGAEHRSREPALRSVLSQARGAGPPTDHACRRRTGCGRLRRTPGQPVAGASAAGGRRARHRRALRVARPRRRDRSKSSQPEALELRPIRAPYERTAISRRAVR